jgi:hypothetical protein
MSEARLSLCFFVVRETCPSLARQQLCMFYQSQKLNPSIDLQGYSVVASNCTILLHPF